jgi:hypothetical protein
MARHLGALAAIGVGLVAAASAIAAPAATAASSHGDIAEPLIQPTSPPADAGDGLLVPLLPPTPTPPPADTLKVAPPIPVKPPPMVEIIRWKKKKAKRPRYPDFSAQRQTFNAYLSGEQSAIVRWSIAGLQPEPGLCTGGGSSTVVYFASRRPVLVSAGRRSMEDISVPVDITFASTLAHVPDIDSCFGLQPSNACRLDARGLRGTATLSTRGNGTVVRSLYLSSLMIDEASAGVTCVDGIFGFPRILSPGTDGESAVVDARIPWGAVNSRSRQNVNIGRAYGVVGDQSSAGNGCNSPAEGYTCASSSITKWNLRLIRAQQKRLPGLR